MVDIWMFFYAIIAFKVHTIYIEKNTDFFYLSFVRST